MGDSSRIHFDVTANAQAAEKAFAELRAKAIRDLDAIGDESQRINAKINALSAREKLKLDLAPPEFSGKSIESDLNKALARDAVRAFNQDVKRGEPDREKLLWQIDQLRIGAEQLGRGSFGGVPNLLKAWAAGSNESALAAGALSSRTLLLSAAAGAAVISVGLLAKGFVDAANSAATMADELQRLEDQTGLTADRLQYFSAVALSSNIEIKDYTTALTSFRRALQEARNGNEELVSIFKILKQDVNDTSEKSFADLIRKTADLTDESVRAKVEQEVFGGSIRGVARALDEQSKLSDKAREDLQRVSQLQSGEALEAAREYSRNTKLLGLEFDNLVAKIGNAVIPTFNSWLVTLREGKSLIDILAEAMRDLPAVPGELGLSAEGRNTGAITGQGTPNPFAGVTGFSTKFVGKGSDKDSSSGKLRSLFSGGSKRKGKRKGKEDISELEKELRILRAAEAEARDLLDSRRESVLAYLEAREKVFEVERKLAQLELPNERAAKLKEIDQRELAARRDYFQALEKIAADELEKAQKSVEDNIRVQQQRLEAERKFLQELKALDLERAEIELDRRRATLDREKQRGAGSTQDFARGNPRLALQIKELQLERDVIFQRMAQTENARRIQLQAAEREFADLTEQAAVKARINRNIEAEQARHVEAIKEINRQIQVTREQQNPLSARSLMGDNFANNLELFDGEKLTALAATAVQAFDQMSASAGNLGTMAGDAFGKFAQGIGQTVESFVLLGTTGPAFLKKLTAQVLAQLAAQATVKSLFELAEGFAMLFVNPPAAASHFKAAALYGAVAVTAGVAGRAIAGNSFQQGGGSANGAGGAAQGVGATTINRGVRYGDNAQEPKVIILRAEYNKGIIVSEVTSDYKRNGSTRQTMRGDLSNENVSVV